MRYSRSAIAAQHGLAKRVLVTGSRGKSSLVRLLHAAFQASGLESYARITGVVPRELGPDGTSIIRRSTPGHVGEMHWWLKQLPATTQGIVMENSAISPELQDLAGRWLQPDVTVLTNTLPDHQEVWGETSADAASVLVAGIPHCGHLVLPANLADDTLLLELLEARQRSHSFAAPPVGDNVDYRASNLGLALAAIESLGLPPKQARQAMQDLPGDAYDFQVLEFAGARLAMAFSANDIASSQALFSGLQWREQDTHLLYNHRADRPARLRSFLRWLNEAAWRDVTIIGDRPLMRTGRAAYARVRKHSNLLGLFHPGERIFGCGNVAGLPLTLIPE